MTKRGAFALLALGVGAPAAAEEKGAWQVDGRTISVPAARVSLPNQAGVATLTKTGEFSNQGQGIDDYAQYESADGKVFATAYIYRATYADTALAAYATDQSVRARFGDAVKLAQRSVVPVAGQPRGAIRLVYDDAVLNGDRLVTAAAFLRVDGWLVKLRASGPAELRQQVTGTLDALLTGIAVEGGATVFPASPLSFTEPCPAPATSEAKPFRDKKSDAMGLFGGLLGGSAISAAKGKGGDVPLSFPNNGATPVCVRGTLTLGGRRIDLLQPAGEAEPEVALAVLNDAGSVLAIERALVGRGYVIKSYAIGVVETRGSLDRMATTAQLQNWIASANAAQMAVRSRTTIKANGDTEITVDRAVLGK